MPAEPSTVVRSVARRAIPALLVVATACGGGDQLSPPPEGAASPLRVTLEATDLAASPGDTVYVVVRPSHADGPLAGLQGFLDFDPARLAFIGQPLEGETPVIVNDTAAARGTLRFASVNRQGLPSVAAAFAFHVRAPGYLARLGYRHEVAVGPDLREYASASATRSSRAAMDFAPRVAPRRLTLEDWIAYLAPEPPSLRRVARSAGQGLIYGDATLSGTITTADAFTTSSVAVGNQPLLADATKDYAIAANVFPLNLPGLGEAGDPTPPGRQPDGSFLINVSDALVIAQFVQGNPSEVVGKPIPGRAVPSNHAILSGTLTADRTLYRDTVYELQGTVNVPGGVTLTIEAGTRVEGDQTTRGALVIRRGGDINAQGTRLQPVVFTCNAPVKAPGCWGGVVINGLSLLNNGVTQVGPVDVNGCPEKPSIGNGGTYGGCLIEDASGILRYVRIEYGGQSTPSTGPTPGLALLGVGTGTAIDSVQVHGSAGDGVFVSGGTARIRHLVATNNSGPGLRWDDGWFGKAQHVVIHQPPSGAPGLAGSNFALNPNAQTRSNPQLYNVTVVGPGGGTPSGGIVLDNGTDATIRNAVVLGGSAAGLDIRGAATCARASGGTPGILVESSAFFGNQPNFASGACVDIEGYALAPERANRVVNPGLIAPFLTASPDYRPAAASPLTTGFAQPPADGFFDTTVQYVGAVAPANAVGSNVPWYAGWTVGW